MTKGKANKTDKVGKATSSKMSLTNILDTLLKTFTGEDPRANSIIFSENSQRPESQMTLMEKRQRASAGVSKRELELLKARTKLDYDKLSKLLSVTKSSLINMSSLKKFNLILSERIIGLADIYSYGYEVFEDEVKFNHWMLRENQALGGKTPFELCKSQFGREEVRNIIGRIDYGLYS